MSQNICIMVCSRFVNIITTGPVFDLFSTRTTSIILLSKQNSGIPCHAFVFMGEFQNGLKVGDFRKSCNVKLDDFNNFAMRLNSTSTVLQIFS